MSHGIGLAEEHPRRRFVDCGNASRAGPGTRLCRRTPAGAGRGRRLLRFLPMSNAGLGIAIGDISGKGIPAALLMATLRAFLRGRAIDHETDLSTVIANLNRLVFESSAQNRYATFFLGGFRSRCGADAGRVVDAGPGETGGGRSASGVYGWRQRGDESYRLGVG